MHSTCVWNMIKQSKSLQTTYNTTHIYDKYYIRTHVYVFLFSMKKTRVWIIASLTLKVTLWGHPIHGIYWPSLSLHEQNLFEESRACRLWMSGKRNVSVCSGHELANALYVLYFRNARWKKVKQLPKLLTWIANTKLLEKRQVLP